MDNGTPNHDWFKTFIEYCLSKLSFSHITLATILLIFLDLLQPNSSICSGKVNSSTQNQSQSQHNGRADYERLQPGMSLMQVESILGRGIETERSQTTTTFIWKNIDSSSITAVFENGKLKRKSQSNLQ